MAAADKTLAELAERLGYRFTRPQLLALALTHRSRREENNERLEFLGDSVLNLVISTELFRRYPNLSEGALTRMRAALVREGTLATLARSLALGDCLMLGGGELKSGGFDRDSILADALEAVFGAIYEDGGHERARAVVLRLYQDLIAALDPRSIPKDPKTELQEYLQKLARPLPSYGILEVTGEAHSQQFTVACLVDGLPEAVRGEGASRRAAEQQAASRALSALLAKDAAVDARTH